MLFFGDHRVEDREQFSHRRDYRGRRSDDPGQGSEKPDMGDLSKFSKYLLKIRKACKDIIGIIDDRIFLTG